jgi:signal transduction histidine kinase
MLSIKAKIIIYTEILFGIILCFFAVILYEDIKHAEIVRLDSKLEQYVSGFNRVVSNSLASLDFPDTTDIIEIENEGPEGIQFKITDTLGNRIFSTIDADLSLKSKLGFYDSIYNSNLYRCLLVILEPEPGKEYILLAAVPLKIVNATLHKFFIIFAILIPLFLLVSSFISWLILSVAFRPLRNIIITAQNISEQNLHCKLELPKAKDEIRMLGKVFNEMIARLEVAFKGQKQFVADASHELRTPLAIIRSELEFAQRHKLESPVEECLTIAISEIDRLSNLTESLLTISQFDVNKITNHITKFELNDFLSEIINFFKCIATQKGISLNFSRSKEVFLQGNFDLLKRAVLNVVDNAVKYSPKNSVVNILSDIDLKKNSAIISIEDNGPGISIEDQANIFNRFYRSESTRSVTQGFGLGLPISEQIIKLHRGEIIISSELGKGSKFKIILPVL